METDGPADGQAGNACTRPGPGRRGARISVRKGSALVSRGRVECTTRRSTTAEPSARRRAAQREVSASPGSDRTGSGAVSSASRGERGSEARKQLASGRSGELGRTASTMVSDSGMALGCTVFCLYGRGISGLCRFTSVRSVNIGRPSVPAMSLWLRRIPERTTPRRPWSGGCGASGAWGYASSPAVLSGAQDTGGRGLTGSCALRPWSGGIRGPPAPDWPRLVARSRGRCAGAAASCATYAFPPVY